MNGVCPVVPVCIGREALRKDCGAGFAKTAGVIARVPERSAVSLTINTDEISGQGQRVEATSGGRKLCLL
jgi:hypothetical protein